MARDAFHAVKSMSILCLWDIQLTFDRNGVGTYGAYHHKSKLTRCNRVQNLFKSAKLCGSYRDFRTGKLNANGQYSIVHVHFPVAFSCRAASRLEHSRYLAPCHQTHIYYIYHRVGRLYHRVGRLYK